MRTTFLLKQVGKWIRMANGNSSLTVEQGQGKCWATGRLRGYYNDFTNKVFSSVLVDENGIPYNITSTGEKVYLPVPAIQYALGCFDLYLLHNDYQYIEKMAPIIAHLIETQHDSGGWGTDILDQSLPYYSAMAQGEAISLLLRAKNVISGYDYECIINKAYSQLIKNINCGGCCYYENDKVLFMEYQDSPFILNGGVFALWGLYDYCLSEYGNDDTKGLLMRAISSLVEFLDEFDLGYWTKYSSDGKIASPFYHRLHVAQLVVLDKQFPNAGFLKYVKRFSEYALNNGNMMKAVIKKGVQKFKEKPQMVIVR